MILGQYPLLAILGVAMIILALLNLIYQLLPSSTLALIGIICLNFSYIWFDWRWLIWFILLWVIATSASLFLTAKESQKVITKFTWLPVVSAILGAILIPIPILGALIGVFVGALIAIYASGSNQKELNNQNKPLIKNISKTLDNFVVNYSNPSSLSQIFRPALQITIHYFFGVVIEVTIVIGMLMSTLILALL